MSYNDSTYLTYTFLFLSIVAMVCVYYPNVYTCQLPRAFYSASLTAEREQANMNKPILEPDATFFVDPLDLICWWRFDLVAKYIYATHWLKGVEQVWARELYAAHLMVWGNGKEWDGSRSTIAEYITAFHDVLVSIKKNGFDEQRSRICVDPWAIAREGAHRIIAALCAGVQVPCYYDAKLTHRACQATARFFKEFDMYVPGGLRDEYLDDMARVYAQLKHHTRILVIRGVTDVEAIQKTIRNHTPIVYYTSKKLSANVWSTVAPYLYSGTGGRRLCDNHDSMAHCFLLDNANDDRMQQLLRDLCMADSDCRDVAVTVNRDDTVALGQIIFHKTTLQYCAEHPDVLQLTPAMQQAYAVLDQWRATTGIASEDIGIIELDKQGVLSIICHAPSEIVIGVPGTLHIKSGNALSANAIATIYNPKKYRYHYGYKWILKNLSIFT